MILGVPLVRFAWVAGLVVACGATRASAPRERTTTLPRPVVAPEPALPTCPTANAPVITLAGIDPSLVTEKECVLAGLDASIDGPVPLYARADLGTLLGYMTRSAPAALSEFQDGTDVARVHLVSQARVRAFVHAASFELHARRNLWIHAQHVSASPGSPLRIERRENGAFQVRVATRFDEPKELSARASCDELALGEPLSVTPDTPAEAERVLPESDVIVQLRSDEATLYDAPHGKQLFTYRFTLEPNYPFLIERRAGFGRVTAWYRNIGIDAWIPEAQFFRPKRIGGGHFVTTPRVRVASEPPGTPAITSETTPVLVDTAEGALPIGELPAGTLVALAGQSAGHATLLFRGLTPPPGASFRVKVSALRECTPASSH